MIDMLAFVMFMLCNLIKFKFVAIKQSTGAQCGVDDPNDLIVIIRNHAEEPIFVPRSNCWIWSNSKMLVRIHENNWDFSQVKDKYLLHSTE